MSTVTAGLKQLLLRWVSWQTIPAIPSSASTSRVPAKKATESSTDHMSLFSVKTRSCAVPMRPPGLDLQPTLYVDENWRERPSKGQLLPVALKVIGRLQSFWPGSRVVRPRRKEPVTGQRRGTPQAQLAWYRSLDDDLQRQFTQKSPNPLQRLVGQPVRVQFDTSCHKSIVSGNHFPLLLSHTVTFRLDIPQPEIKFCSIHTPRAFESVDAHRRCVVLRVVNAMASNNDVSYSSRRSGQSTLRANCENPPALLQPPRRPSISAADSLHSDSLMLPPQAHLHPFPQQYLPQACA
jgi:hypothetical protein